MTGAPSGSMQQEDLESMTTDIMTSLQDGTTEMTISISQGTSDLEDIKSRLKFTMSCGEKIIHAMLLLNSGRMTTTTTKFTSEMNSIIPTILNRTLNTKKERLMPTHHGKKSRCSSNKVISTNSKESS